MYNIDKKEIIRTFKLFYTGGSSMKKIRNILAMLMVFVMLVAVMPMNVFATDSPTEPGAGQPAAGAEENHENEQQDPPAAPVTDLDTAKAEAVKTVDTLSDLSQANKEAAKQAINNASTIEDVKAELGKAQKLNDTKAQAREDLKKLTDLTEDQAKEANKSIDDASDIGAVTTAVTKAKGQDEKAKEAKEEKEKKAAEELANAKKEAKDAVDKLEKLSQEDKDKYKKAIEDANDKAGVEKALKEAKEKANPSTPPAPAADKYPISVWRTYNGTASTNVLESEAGKTITVTADPARGYVVDRIVVKDNQGNPLTLSNKKYKNYYDDYPYYLRSRWYRGNDYDDYIRWCDIYDYSRYDYSSFKRWCKWNGYSYDYDDFKRWYDYDDIYDYRWYNRYNYNYSYNYQADFTMPASAVTVEVTFTSAPYWYDGYYYDYETGTYRYYYDDDYYYYRNKKDNYYERQKKAEAAKKEEEEAKAKAEAEKLPQIYENKAVIAIGSNVLDKVSKNVHTVHQMDTPAYVNNGRVMLPLRYVAEALGLQVSWVPETKTVIIWDLTQRVEIPVKSNRIIVNGITYTSDVKPEIKSSRTMLPIANIARALGLIDGSDIIWDQYNKQVTLTRKVLSK